jgi:hypothetical protein
MTKVAKTYVAKKKSSLTSDAGKAQYSYTLEGN